MLSDLGLIFGFVDVHVLGWKKRNTFIGALALTAVWLYVFWRIGTQFPILRLTQTGKQTAFIYLLRHLTINYVIISVSLW